MFRYRQAFNLGESPASIALSPNGKLLITGGRDDLTIKIWDLQNGQVTRSWLAAPLSPYRGLNSIPALAISPDGETLVTGGSSLKVKHDTS